jgi:hypothetical protein
VCSARKSLTGSLLRLAMVPLSLPCLCAAFCCCSVSVGSSEASEGRFTQRLGGPQNETADGVTDDVACVSSVAGTTGVPNCCCCCPFNSDARQPLVIHRSNERRIRSMHSVLLVSRTGSAVGGSSTVEFRSSISAQAASCLTSAESCIVLCRLLL